jgi:hypothetical protein
LPNRAALLAASLLTFVCLTRTAAASWVPDGLPVAVAPCEEFAESVVPDGAGGVILFWGDNRTCGDFNLFAQRITGAGRVAPGWDSLGIAICKLPGEQATSIAVPDGVGGAVVVWQDSRSGNFKLYAQRIDSTGAVGWQTNGLPLCLAQGAQAWFTSVSDGEGGVVVCWTDYRYGRTDDTPHHHPLPNVFAQHVASNGSRAWADTGIVVCSDSLGQFSPSVLQDGTGGYLFTWFDDRGSAYVQHVDIYGRPQLAQDGVPVPGQFLGIPAADGAGGIISAFNIGSDDSEDVYVQRIRGDGSPVWPLNGLRITNVIYKQEVSALLPDGTGGGFVAWHDLRNGHDWDVYLQRFTGSGQIAPGWPDNGLPVCTAPGFQVYPALVGDDAGGCVVMWYDSRDSVNEYDLYAQRITADGTVATGWPTNGVRFCGAPGNQDEPIGVRDGTGGVLATWQDYRIYADVYAQRVGGSGVVGDTSVAGVLSPLSASATLDSIRVTWQRGASALFTATVERSENSGAWLAVGDVRPDATGRMTFVDAQVDPGQTYSYRLRPGASAQVFGQVSARVPGALNLDFSIVGANPVTSSRLTLSLTVPSRDPVDLELFDLQGRREMHEVFTPPQLSPMIRTLALSSRTRAGLYFVRLTQSGHSISRRISVLR